jgi:lipopolysaccharide/colanic/teichoic acid biosynthesis glycosyltransferase
MSRTSLYQRFGKRPVDLLVTVPLFILISPLMLLIGLCSLLFLGKPVLFRQVRPGYLENPFTIYKFRTMHDVAGLQGHPLPDGQRLNRFGSFLRRTSLDELPEFWNVLRGDMSVVGPRPLLLKYLPFFSDEERIRFTVRPGITGWAQVNGRNEASWDDRLRNDVWYVQNCSLLLDFRILWITLLKTVRCKQVVVDPGSTMLNLDQERAHTKASRA